MFVSDVVFDIEPGRLAFITLEGEGAQVPADGELDLSPAFFDAYNNQLETIALNWSLDGNDITLEMLLNQGRWVATSVGGHELRVNADGVFATVRFTVVPGSAHALTPYDQEVSVQAGKPFDLFVQTVDVHGNIAPATNVTTDLNSSIGELIPSPTGLGYWGLSEKRWGCIRLILTEGGAMHAVELEIEPGDPVRIQASLNREALAEGDSVLLMAFGTDAYGNTVTIPKENTTVSCTTGDVSFITNGTWEVDVENGGTDRSCTIRWNGLLAQTFFDVDEVLLGGAVGSTNTAMAMAAVLLCLLLAVLVVLTRRAAKADDKEWVDEYFDDDEDEEDEEAEAPSLDRQTTRRFTSATGLPWNP